MPLKKPICIRDIFVLENWMVVDNVSGYCVEIQGFDFFQ